MNKNNNGDNGQERVIALVPFSSDHDSNMKVCIYSMLRGDKVFVPTDPKEAAAAIVRNENQRRHFTHEVSIFVEWHNEIYTGAIQQVYMPERRDIVYLGKSSKPVSAEIVQEIKRFEPDRATVPADDSLDLKGKGFVLGLIHDELAKLTHEQEEYVKSQPELRVQII